MKPPSKSPAPRCPRQLESVGILFCDVVGFTAYCNQHSAQEVHAHLQRLVETFERITAERGMEKIKTIGDAFMAVAQAPVPVEERVLTAVRCGLALIAAAKSQPPFWTVRVGVHAGPVAAGVVGHRKYQYDIWGDTVNLAKRLQEAARPGTVCVAADLDDRLGALPAASSGDRIELKGRGAMEVLCIEPPRARDWTTDETKPATTARLEIH